MIGKGLVESNREEVKIVAELIMSERSTSEEMAGLKRILLEAGLLVEVEGHELIILSKVRSGEHR